MDGFIDENVLLVITGYVAVILALVWLALVIWAYRDMRSRSRDPLAALFVGAVVLLLNIPGALVYALLRPRETLSEAYERSLEEEALLQEIEEKPACPGCGQRIQGDWQACPYCHTRLKKPCITCTQLLELSWDLCPHCATMQTQHRGVDSVNSRHVQPAPASVDIADKWLNSAPTARPTRPSADAPQYIDDDYR